MRGTLDAGGITPTPSSGMRLAATRCTRDGLASGEQADEVNLTRVARLLAGCEVSRGFIELTFVGRSTGEVSHVFQ